jgi:PAS domain S-box-containing protein
MAEAILNFFLVMMAYAGSGLFVREVVESRRNLLEFTGQLQRQQSLRRQAEDRLRILAESSPAAIMTLGQNGAILAANHAAVSLFGAESGQDLTETKIGRLLPVLQDALAMADSGESFRTAAQCQGRRLNGTPFNAHVWFSTYSTAEGRHLAVIAVDSSDEVREREEANLRQLLTSNRVLTAAVLHEIRSLCASISTAYTNLTAAEAETRGRETHVLGTMITALGKLASTNLQGASRENLSAVKLPSVLDQFRIIAEPAWQEIDGVLEVRTNKDLPAVIGDPQGLLQVLLNLMSNSLRAVESSTERRFLVEATLRGEKIVLSAEDSGAGVNHPESLFVPFQSGADRVGLGLFLSRALMRSFGGELRYVATPIGCRFELELAVAAHQGESHLWLT